MPAALFFVFRLLLAISQGYAAAARYGRPLASNLNHSLPQSVAADLGKTGVTVIRKIVRVDAGLYNIEFVSCPAIGVEHSGVDTKNVQDDVPVSCVQSSAAAQDLLRH